MIPETLGKAHGDGVLQGALIGALIVSGVYLPAPAWCIVLGAALVLTFVVAGLNRRFKKIDEGEWPTAYYDGKITEPRAEGGDKNGK